MGDLSLNQKIYKGISTDITNMVNNILRYPRLDTVLMVEKFIKKKSGEHKKKSLWQNLPKKMMYQTFCVIYDYLIDSSKIMKTKDSTIIWIYDPNGIKKILSKGVKLR